MEIRSSINILFSKFNINYRVLLYMFVIIMVILAIAVSIVTPTFKEVFESDEVLGLMRELRGSFSSYFSGDASFSEFTMTFGNVYNSIISILDAKNILAIFWVTFIITSLLIRLATSFAYPAIMDVINNFMSSNMTYGFFSNILKNIKTCLNFGFWHGIFSFILDTIAFYVVIGVVKLLLPVINIFALAIGLVVAVIVVGTRLTISSGVLPEMIVGEEKSYFKALRNSVPNIKNNFSKIFGAYCVSLFCTYSIIVIMTIVTFGIAFFVLCSVYLTYVNILQIVFYYEFKSKRYYTDPYTIINTAPIEERIDLQEELLKKDED